MNYFKHMLLQSSKAFALLSVCCISLTANAELSLDESSLLFAPSNIGETQELQALLTSSGSLTLTAQDFNLQQFGAGDYSVDTSNCENVELQNSPCFLSVSFSASIVGKQAALLTITNPNDGNQTPLYVSNFFKQPVEQESRRRLAPIVANVQVRDISDPNNPVLVDTNELSEDTPYQLTWLVMSYDKILSKPYIVECTKSSANDDIYDTFDEDCAAVISELQNSEESACSETSSGTSDSFDPDAEPCVQPTSNAINKVYQDTTNDGIVNGSFVKAYNAQFIDAPILTGNEKEQLSLETFSYSGKVATYQQFATNFIIAQGTASEINNTFVIRFYSQEQSSVELGLTSGISNILSGKIDFLNQAEAGFFKNDGRRLSFNVTVNE
ncbi:hypothetical protein [Thalassomonas sp. M1454]|uniref:hypothetical protein n=1 Tax=Thalassomonas sp. M1454 TaxID=2594477 RepID=UPI00117C2093|nr:hypothetical protein [Thalassomonas sp. M1454]TRX57211.1 hypothetical protein FNN08_06845 [Thalassomonas sp. M1454]